MTGSTPSSETDQVAPPAAPPDSRIIAATPAGPGHRTPRRRRWVTWLRAIALVVVLPVVALLIGLLVAWIVHQIRGNPAAHPAVRIVPPRSASASGSAAPSAAPRTASAAVVPSDWVAEDAPPIGVTYSHPVGWIRRTSAPEVLRFAPAAAGSTAPGVEGVGAGIEPGVTPAKAVGDFATRVYGSQPGFVVIEPASAVPASAAGARPGEFQEIVAYRRSGVDVRVVIHSFTAGGKTVLVLGRAANAQPARAAQLEAFVEASIKVS